MSVASPAAGGGGAFLRVLVLFAAWCALTPLLAVVVLGVVPRFQDAGPPVVIAALAVSWLLPLLVARVLASPWTTRQPRLATRASAVLFMALLLQAGVVAAVHVAAAPLDPVALESTARQALAVLGAVEAPPPAVAADKPAEVPALEVKSAPAGEVPAPPTEAEQLAAVKKAVAAAPRGSMFLWTDAQGNTHITQEAPAEGARHVVVEAPSGTYAEEGAEPGGKPLKPPREEVPSRGGQKLKLKGVTGAGDALSAESLRGAQALVVHVLPTCGACARQVKALAGFNAARVVYALRDGGSEGGNAAMAWAQKHGVPPASVVAVAPRLMPTGAYPQTAAVDAQGQVKGWHTGATSADELARLLATP